MDVLVLGGTGMIGTAITRGLLARGHAVTHLTRGRTSRDVDGGVRLVVGDRTSRDDLRRAEEAAGAEVVIDMICFTAEDAMASVDAFRGGVDHYIMCSTVDVYTKRGSGFPITEDSERQPSPTFRYAYAKNQAETVLWTAASEGSLPVTVLRPAATYAQSTVAPIGSFEVVMDRLRRGEPIIVHGDGSSLWVSCHRDDVAQAFVNCVGNEATKGKAYNVAGSELLTWNAYWLAVAQAAGTPAPRFVHIPTEVLHRIDPELSEWCWANFQYNNYIDSSRAARDLGFSSTRSWAEGVSDIRWDLIAPAEARSSARYQRIVTEWCAAIDGLATRFADDGGSWHRETSTEE